MKCYFCKKDTYPFDESGIFTYICDDHEYRIFHDAHDKTHKLFLVMFELYDKKCKPYNHYSIYLDFENDMFEIREDYLAMDNIIYSCPLPMIGNFSPEMFPKMLKSILALKVFS